MTSWEECQSVAIPLSAFPYCNESLSKSSLFTFCFLIISHWVEKGYF